MGRWSQARRASGKAEAKKLPAITNVQVFPGTPNVDRTTVTWDCSPSPGTGFRIRVYGNDFTPGAQLNDDSILDPVARDFVSGFGIDGFFGEIQASVAYLDVNDGDEGPEVYSPVFSTD